MSNYKSPQSIIDTYKKRQRRLPILIGVISALVLIGGVVLIVMSFSGGDLSISMPSISIFASPTFTPTVTNTATPIPPTATATMTLTATLIPTETIEPTPSGPFEYTVQEGDNCWSIATEYEVELAVLLALNNFDGDCPISPGDTIYIPAPDTELEEQTPTPVSEDVPRGTEVEYTVKSGDSLSAIVEEFRSLLSVVMERNELEDANSIYVGQTLIIPVNLPTATPEP